MLRDVWNEAALKFVTVSENRSNDTVCLTTCETLNFKQCEFISK